MRTVIEVTNLSKTYGKNEIVSNLNFRVRTGEIFALLGLNGAGKSTTIKMLMGLTTPTKGKVKYFNQSFLENQESIYPRIGSIVEYPGFYENLTVFDNLKLVTNIVGVHKPNYIDELLNIVGLTLVKTSKVKELTLSEKQKLAIAKSLLNNPSVLILDEPLNGLDPISINEMRTLFLRLAKEKGTTIFISSHVLGEVEKMADRIAILHDGRILDVFDKKQLETDRYNNVMIRVESTTKAAIVLKEHHYKFRIKTNHIILIQSESDVNKVMDLLIQNSIQLYEIYPEKPNLEEYFIELIQNDESGALYE